MSGERLNTFKPFQESTFTSSESVFFHLLLGKACFSLRPHGDDWFSLHDVKLRRSFTFSDVFNLCLYVTDVFLSVVLNC